MLLKKLAEPCRNLVLRHRAVASAQVTTFCASTAKKPRQAAGRLNLSRYWASDHQDGDELTEFVATMSVAEPA